MKKQISMGIRNGNKEKLTEDEYLFTSVSYIEKIQIFVILLYISQLVIIPIAILLLIPY